MFGAIRVLGVPGINDANIVRRYKVRKLDHPYIGLIRFGVATAESVVVEITVGAGNLKLLCESCDNERTQKEDRKN